MPTPNILLIQLPVPQTNFGLQTANIPFGAACLKQSGDTWARHGHRPLNIDIIPESLASYLADAAMIDLICERQPDVVGFSTFLWNVKRVLHFAAQIKSRTGARIILGGPEITPDNTLIESAFVDLYVFGPGENLFPDLMESEDIWSRGRSWQGACPVFGSTPNPYPYGGIPLEHHIGKMMLLETTRGCAYRCAYCYYGKAMRQPVYKDEAQVLGAVQWAVEQGLEEIYVLDPSLDARPGLRKMLRKIAAITAPHGVRLISEIRAEAVDADLAGLLAQAGFSWLEVGLQSVNPVALSLMRRRTDLGRFLNGVGHLKKAGIKLGIDLILGLPGDDLPGFRTSVDFVKQHRLDEDIQVFPLSLLPGTAFRRNQDQYGLVYDPNPPYSLLRSASFSGRQMRQAYAYAEEKLETTFFPPPGLYLAWRSGWRQDMAHSSDKAAVIENGRYLFQVWCHPRRSQASLRQTARRLCHPYQLIVPPDQCNRLEIEQAISLLSQQNPHTSLEIIFFEPNPKPDPDHLLRCLQLDRPHYLDSDLRYLFPEPGNRAVIFTQVTGQPQGLWEGAMQRNVYWWRDHSLPAAGDIHKLETLGFEGLLIDTPVGDTHQRAWQDRMAPQADDLLLISFGAYALQHRWLGKTASDDHYLDILPRA